MKGRVVIHCTADIGKQLRSGVIHQFLDRILMRNAVSIFGVNACMEILDDGDSGVINVQVMVPYEADMPLQVRQWLSIVESLSGQLEGFLIRGDKQPSSISITSSVTTEKE